MHPVLLWRALARRLRQVVFDRVWGKSAGRVLLGPGLTFDPHMTLELAAGVTLSHHGSFSGPGRVTIGARSYLGPFFSIQCVDEVSIGEDCLFGNFVSIVDNDHGRAANEPVNTQPLSPAPVRVGNDCWLGEKSIILRGVTIGDHAIVAAGALVRADVPPYAIVGGIPARIISRRV